jgi:hypothetical protein
MYLFVLFRFSSAPSTAAAVASRLGRVLCPPAAVSGVSGGPGPSAVPPAVPAVSADGVGIADRRQTKRRPTIRSRRAAAGSSISRHFACQCRAPRGFWILPHIPCFFPDEGGNSLLLSLLFVILPWISSLVYLPICCCCFHFPSVPFAVTIQLKPQITPPTPYFPEAPTPRQRSAPMSPVPASAVGPSPRKVPARDCSHC